MAAFLVGSQLLDIPHALRPRIEQLNRWRWLKVEEVMHASTHWHNPLNSCQATSAGNRALSWIDAWQVVSVIAAVLVLVSLQF